MATLTVKDGLDEFFHLLPAWADERHRALIAIAFASGAYAAASIAAAGDPDDAKEQARALCLRLQGDLDAMGVVH